MSEKGSKLSLPAGRKSEVQPAPAVNSSSAARTPFIDPAPVAVLIIDRGGCVKTLNSAAESLFASSAKGQAWPLLRNATFKAHQGSALLTARNGSCYIEQHSTDTNSGDRILCLQSATVATDQAQSLAALGESVARLVHQVRTPLTAAALYLDQLNRQLGHEPQLQQLARKPVQQLRAAEKIISSSLGLLRPARFELQTISAQEVLQRLEDQCAVVVLSMGAHLYCASAPENLSVRAEPEVLISALSNLVINAAQHPAKGRLLRVCVVARQVDGCIEFDISDTGKGVPEDMQKKIFNAFETSRSDGTGLGLAVAESSLRQFDGQIALKNNAEGGATFCVRFPAEALDVAA